MRSLILTFAVCLLLTVILEETAALIAGVRKGFDLTIILFTNTLTNPVAVFCGLAFEAFTPVPKVLYIAVIEAAVFVTEALIYKKALYAKKPSPFILSLILNGVSFVIGSPIAAWILDKLI
ncbi:MAG: hypothetical protein J5777_08200 [Clostridiales bacterium]|nr:hypothetical protein [Clostridiales bacterium]